MLIGNYAFSGESNLTIFFSPESFDTALEIFSKFQQLQFSVVSLVLIGNYAFSGESNLTIFSPKFLNIAVEIFSKF